MTVYCPICGANGKKVEMVRYEGLPPYLDLTHVARRHPLPIVRTFAENTVRQVQERIEQSVYYYKCPSCKNIQIFER